MPWSPRWATARWSIFERYEPIPLAPLSIRATDGGAFGRTGIYAPGSACRSCFLQKVLDKIRHSKYNKEDTVHNTPQGGYPYI